VRVQIISDIEGVAGIVKWAQTSGGEALYQEGRRLYTAEINAAVRGAKAAGAREIVVMDCHGADGDYMFNSLLADELDRDCEFVVQSEWTEYTEFLEAAEVKVGLGRFSARNLSPRRARDLIEDAAERALRDLRAVPPYDPGSPCEIEVEFTTADRLVEYRNRRGVEQVDALTLVSKAGDWWSAWSQFYF